MQASHDCFFIIADLHSLTTRPAASDIAELPGHVRAIVLDYLAAGVNPEESTIYLQSGVPAVYDLAILLQMLTPRARLAEIGTVAEMARVAGVPDDEVSMGLLGYPVLQAADILMARAEVIPVGGDNLAHVEIARDLAAHFNEAYASVFPLPQARTSRVPLLPGIGPLDGASPAKMSKSAGNVISLSADRETVADSLAQLDPVRLRAFADAFIEDREDAATSMAEHERGALSDAALRAKVVEAIDQTLAPIRERRATYAADPGLVEEILVDGTIRAREVAYATLQEVRRAMGLESLWQGLVDVAEARAKERRKNVHG
jgi:tryptophanyl-tRNA synthetase